MFAIAEAVKVPRITIHISQKKITKIKDADKTEIIPSYDFIIFMIVKY